MSRARRSSHCSHELALVLVGAWHDEAGKLPATNFGQRSAAERGRAVAEPGCRRFRSSASIAEDFRAALRTDARQPAASNYGPNHDRRRGNAGDEVAQFHRADACLALPKQQIQKSCSQLRIWPLTMLASFLPRPGGGTISPAAVM